MSYSHPIGCCLAAFVIGAVSPAFAEDDHSHHDHHGHGGDLMLFPAVTAIHLSRPVSGLVQDKLQPEINLFYSSDWGRWRFLAEFLVRDTEQEMERLQAGWLANSALTLWLGRFHSPLGFWNSKHHHGAYLQTTISRPAILDFEDEHGPLPTHITGVLAEGSLDRLGGQFNYSAGIGRGPMLEDELVPLDVLRPRDQGRLAASVRLSYRPAGENRGEFGISAAHTRIPITVAAAYDSTDQTVASAFYELDTERFRVVGEAFHVANRLTGPGTSRNASFNALYLQPEYRVDPSWTVFARLEDANRTGGDPYLDLLPHYTNRRAMAGARMEVGKNQALKLELSRNEKQNDGRYNQVSLQWSMVWP